MEQKTSPSCIRHVERALHEVEGVEHVEVHLREGKVVVRHEVSTELAPRSRCWETPATKPFRRDR